MKMHYALYEDYLKTVREILEITLCLNLPATYNIFPSRRSFSSVSRLLFSSVRSSLIVVYEAVSSGIYVLPYSWYFFSSFDEHERALRMTASLHLNWSIFWLVLVNFAVKFSLSSIEPVACSGIPLMIRYFRLTSLCSLFVDS